MKLFAVSLLGVLLQSLALHAAAMPPTLFELAGMKPAPGRLSDSVLVIVDAQREYVDGKLPLAGMAPSIRAAAVLLARARKAGTPVIHVVQRGKGGLFDPATPYYEIVPQLRPARGETVVEKTLPNAFAATDLAGAIERTGRKSLILIGYMTHMCLASTARSALDHAYRSTIVASATATRDLPDGRGGVISAAALQASSLAALADRFAVVVRDVGDIPE